MLSYQFCCLTVGDNISDANRSNSVVITIIIILLLNFADSVPPLFRMGPVPPVDVTLFSDCHTLTRKPSCR